MTLYYEAINHMPLADAVRSPAGPGPVELLHPAFYYTGLCAALCCVQVCKQPRGHSSVLLWCEPKRVAAPPGAAQMTIMYSNPAACALLAWLLRGERLGGRGCAGIAATLLGVIAVSQPPFLFGGHAWSHARLVGARVPRPLPTRAPSCSWPCLCPAA